MRGSGPWGRCNAGVTRAGTVCHRTWSARDSYAAPVPHGPKVDGRDLSGETTREALAAGSVRVHWVENFAWSRRVGGEAHCARNALRDPSGVCRGGARRGQGGAGTARGGDSAGRGQRGAVTGRVDGRARVATGLGGGRVPEVTRPGRRQGRGGCARRATGRRSSSRPAPPTKPEGWLGKGRPAVTRSSRRGPRHGRDSKRSAQLNAVVATDATRRSRRDRHGRHSSTQPVGRTQRDRRGQPGTADRDSAQPTRT
ncbi:protein-arginine deiminase family protein [Streptomyces afghaniensis]|uniref:protein-arginine deiminase family protein n=1 Tax=Streptomyces afghaniensis TaxID=66865 RepID=UPI00358F23E1